MRRINLLPPEERRRSGGGGVGSQGTVLGILLILGAIMLVLVIGIYLLMLARLNSIEDDIVQLDGQIAQQNEQIASLSPYQDIQARLDAKKPIADGIFRTRFSWDEFLQGLAFVIPERTALDSMTGQASPINIEVESEASLSPAGAITFTGIALPQYTNVADFVVRMNNLNFLANSQLNTAELDRETFAEPAINFEVASQLITEVGGNGAELRIDGGPADGSASEQENTNEDIASDQASRPGDER